MVRPAVRSARSTAALIAAFGGIDIDHDTIADALGEPVAHALYLDMPEWFGFGRVRLIVTDRTLR